MRNARSYIFGAAEGAVSSVLTSIFNAYEDEMDGLQLLAALDGINAAIEVQLGVINGIFTRVASEEDGTIDGYNAMYQKHVDSYNALTPHEKTTADGVAATPGYPGAGILPERTPPTVDTFGVHACGSPHGNCYGYYKDAKYHWRSCMHKHGVSGETNVEYWTCQPGGCLCPRRSEHWIACRGATCNVLFPPPTFSYIQYGTYPYSYAEYYDHEIVCKVPVHSWWNSNATCDKTWFPCEGGCPHRAASGLFPTQTSIARYATHNVKLITDEPYRNVYWYVRPPGVSNDMATFVEMDPGDGSTTEAFMSYTFNSTHPTGQWTVIAYIGIGSNSINASYPLYVTD